VSSTAIREQRGIARPNGWWGMVVFVALEATLFGTLVGSYVYLRFRAGQWPPAGIEEPKVLAPVLLTALLAATSVPVALAHASARRARSRPALLLLLLALAVQCVYLALQLNLFVDDLHSFSPQSSAYASIYFTLVGAHHAHVVVAMLLEAWLVVRLGSGVTRYRLVALEATAFYVYFVSVLALVVVGVQVSAAL